jgi:hypothetical protein
VAYASRVYLHDGKLAVAHLKNTRETRMLQYGGTWRRGHS